MKLKQIISPTLVICFGMAVAGVTFTGCARPIAKPLGPSDPCMDQDQYNFLGLFSSATEEFNMDCATLTTLRMLADNGKIAAARKLVEYMAAENTDIKAAFEAMKAKGLISEEDFEPPEEEDPFDVTEKNTGNGEKTIIFSPKFPDSLKPERLKPPQT